MIKHINTGIAELIAVKVPDGTYGFSTERRTGNRMHLTWLEERLLYPKGSLEILDATELPKGDWSLLGIAHDLTEEVWESVLPKARMLYFDTATESGLSLLEANEIYAVNPYGWHEPECGNTCSCVAGCYENARWNKAQQNVGKWVMLKKINEQ